MALYRLAGNAVGLIAAKKLVVQPGPLVPQAQVTHSLLLLAAVIAAVLIAALIVTLAGVRETAAAPAEHVAAGQPWQHRAGFGWLIGSRALVSMGLYLILPFFAFYLRFALHVVAWLQTSLSLLLTMIVWSLVGTLPAGFLGDRVPKKTIMYAALALLGGGAIVLSQVRSDSALWLLAAVLGIGWGAYYSVDWSLACNLLPEGRAGALMAIWNIGASGPQVLSPLVGGLVADRIGAAAHDLGAGYRALFTFVGGYVIAGAIALAFVREPRGGKAAGIE
jgi:MFS family permease